MNRRSAIAAIERAGVLLVFPIDNQKDPASLWYHFFPRKPMRWEWDETGDDSVSDLWILRGELSTSRKVVYTKWYRGRATYFSRPVFTAMLRALNPLKAMPETLSENSRKVLEVLEAESPLSTKELKRLTGLNGKANERAYEKALQELWSRLLIVAYGEVDDGAFPSLAVGSTHVLFEELWSEAFRMEVDAAEAEVLSRLTQDNAFYRHYLKLKEKRKLPARSKELGKPSDRRHVAAVVKFEDL